jgi:acyl-CoA synthetase (AMP-forming)/AMP-acid ligase II
MRYDLESMRWIGYGASPMPVEVVKQAIRDIGNVFVQVYGLTETYILTLLPKEGHVIGGSEDALRRIRSCGKALPGCLVRVVDASGQDVGTGETGEIIAAGDSVTSGYWNLPEETAQATRDGWFYTGDLASIDEDGYMYIVDRKKEIIVSGGENVSPREVEEVIYSHPAVFEATVIGVPDEKWGEAVRAVIVRKEGQVVTADDIMMLCKQNLAGFKIPKSVEFMDSLPKTASGKTARKELKDRFLG